MDSIIELNQYIINDVYNEKNRDLSIRILEKNKLNDFNIIFEIANKTLKQNYSIRMSFEKHEENPKHKELHYQGKFFDMYSEFLRSGELHLTFIINDEAEILNLSKGYMIILTEVLRELEKKHSIQKNTLINHFFAQDMIPSLRRYKQMFVKKVYESLLLDNKNLLPHSLIEIKVSKSHDLDNINTEKKVFFLLKLIMYLTTFKPILEKPLISYVKNHSKLNLSYKETKEIIYNLYLDTHFQKFNIDNFNNKAQIFLTDNKP